MGRKRAVAVASVLLAMLSFGVLTAPRAKIADHVLTRHAEIAALESPGIARSTLLGAHTARRSAAHVLFRVLASIVGALLALWAYLAPSWGYVPLDAGSAPRRLRRWAIPRRRGPPAALTLA
jgi:hypothetical protein